MASDVVFQPKTVPPTAAIKFADSLADYAFRTEYWDIARTAEREILDMALAACNGRPFGPEAPGLIETAARGFVRQAAAGMIRSVMCGLAAHCESMIELSLGLALGMIARARGCAVLYDFGAQRVFGEPDGDITVRIQPQVCFEHYRVDFLLSMRSAKDSDSGLQVLTKQLVVECDGFEFHDKTREQAERDRERDRYLQARGLSVYRFTGSEIWRDVCRCAETTIAFLWNDIRQQMAIPARKQPASVNVGAMQVLRHG